MPRAAGAVLRLKTQTSPRKTTKYLPKKTKDFPKTTKNFPKKTLKHVRDSPMVCSSAPRAGQVCYRSRVDCSFSHRVPSVLGHSPPKHAVDPHGSCSLRRAPHDRYATARTPRPQHQPPRPMFGSLPRLRLWRHARGVSLRFAQGVAAGCSTPTPRRSDGTRTCRARRSCRRWKRAK